jgi:hypothetical protein
MLIPVNPYLAKFIKYIGERPESVDERYEAERTLSLGKDGLLSAGPVSPHAG